MKTHKSILFSFHPSFWSIVPFRFLKSTRVELKNDFVMIYLWMNSIFGSGDWVFFWMQILKSYDELMMNGRTASYLDLNGQNWKVKFQNHLKSGWCNRCGSIWCFGITTQIWKQYMFLISVLELQSNRKGCICLQSLVRSPISKWKIHLELLWNLFAIGNVIIGTNEIGFGI